MYSESRPAKVTIIDDRANVAPNTLDVNAKCFYILSSLYWTTIVHLASSTTERTSPRDTTRGELKMRAQRMQEAKERLRKERISGKEARLQPQPIRKSFLHPMV